LKEADVIKYIEEEAQAVKAERDNDLFELKREEGVMQELLDNLNAEADELDNRSKGARQKQEESNEQIATLKAQIGGIKEGDSA
jgi:predicted  nucleic acid-binding Zn-ribbon protein